MKTLFIDTHLYDINIFLFDNGKIISDEHVIGEKYNSKFLMPTLKKVLDNQIFDNIVVVNGPGSFTGVRLGCTVAKTLAYTLNKPIKMISSLEMMAYSNEIDGYYGLTDSNGYYIGLYKNNAVTDYKYLKNSEYQEFLSSSDVITDVSINYEKVINKSLLKENTNPHLVNPIYIKSIGV